MMEMQSGKFEAQIDKFKITYDKPTVTAPGSSVCELAQSLVFHHSKLGAQPGRLLCPENSFRIEVKGKVAVGPGLLVPTLEIGFVQSLVSSTRKVIYKQEFQPTAQHVFKWEHPFYPIKDGEGDPWYQTGAENLWELKPQQQTEFTVKAWDKPKFFLPEKIKDLPVDDIVFDDLFLTCLAVRLSRTQLYYLHSFEWKCNPSILIISGELSAIGGVEECETKAIPPPYAKPDRIRLEGPSANAARYITVDGLL